MENFFKELFKDEETWRIQSFIDKMKDFKGYCITNQQDEFITAGIHQASAVLQRREAEEVYKKQTNS